jgi:HD-GYP domain-containing protein (c-di-GMP phosphodiesterase class II)
MVQRLLKIAPHDIRAGMYVHALDRHWLQTPVRFQGFHVAGDEPELEWIRRHCEYVLVDADRSEGEEITLETTHAVRTPDAPRLRATPTAGDGLAPAEASARSSPASAAESSTYPASRRRWWHRDAARSSRRAARARLEHAALSRRVAGARAHCTRAARIIEGVLAERRAGGQLDVAAMEEAIMPVVDSVLASTDAMTCVLRLRAWDASAYTRALEVSAWCVVFGKTLGLGRRELRWLGQGGVLLDVGLPTVSDRSLPHAMLATEGGPATLERHVEAGVSMLRRELAIHPRVLQMVRCHHERHDGSGYPRRLAGEEIPLFARMAGLVDTYVAMTSPHTDAPARSAFDVTRTLMAAAGTLFDAELVDQFIRMAGVFPTASLVELNTGELAFVVAQHPQRRLRPRVLVVCDAQQRRYVEPYVADLAELPSDASDSASVWVLRVLDADEYGLDPLDFLP